MVRFFRGFFAGATYPFRAIGFFWDYPQLRKYVVIPILVNFVVGLSLYLGLLVAGLKGIDTAVANLVLPSWASGGGVTIPLLEWLLRIILGLLLLIFTGFLQVQFGVVLGAPWYGMLSEEIEQIRTGQLPTKEPVSVHTIVRDIVRSLLYELKKLLLIIIVGLVLFVLTFLPPFGTVLASAGGIALSATILCLDFFDAPLERRRLRFGSKLGVVGSRLPASATFGVVCLVLVSIPLVNLLSIPLCVTAGTLFCCDRVLPFIPSRLNHILKNSS
ncbi:MAG: EI24 domain-containing protein [Chamaesiphon sp.]